MKESRIENIQKNVLSSVMINFLNLILSFVSRIIFINVLGAGYLGINGLFTNILSILSLADMGMTTAMTYTLYKPLANNDAEKIKALVHFFRKIYLIIACVVLVCGIALLPFLEFIINLDEDIPFIKVYYIISVLNVVVSYLFIYKTTLVYADQKGYKLSKYIVLIRVISTFAQVVILLMFHNYLLYLIVALLFSMTSNIYQNHVVNKLYPYLSGKCIDLNKDERRKIFKDVKALFLYRICGTIQSNTDSVLISIFVGTIYVGYYSNYSMIMTQVIGIITLVFNAIKASVGNLLASENESKEDTFFRYRVLEFLNYWLITFCSVAFIVLLQKFIFMCFGEEYVLEFSLVIAIVLNFYTSNIRQTLWVFREASGLFDETKFITAVTAIINLVLSLLMGYYYGMTGIILATVISRMVYAWWKEPLILFTKCFSENASVYIIMYIKRLIFTVFLCVSTYFISSLIKIVNPYYDFILNIMLCCIIPNGMIFIIYHRSKEFKYVNDMIFQPFVNKLRGMITG